MRPRLLLVLPLAVLLATGCMGPDGDGKQPTGTSTPTDEAPFFDGQAAYAFTEATVTAADRSPAFRVPGTPAHREAAQRLHAIMAAAEGWEVRWQNFTGEDYKGLDKGEVKQYYESPTYCRPADRSRLGGLGFSNLVAHLDGDGSDGRTLILGAHWESKRNATREADRSLWSQPVLGANDGASGVGVLLQLMRHLEGAGFPFDVEVVLFDGEDGFEDCHPLAGSLWFVDELLRQDAAAGAGPDGQPPLRRRMLLLDMVGDPDARFVRESHGTQCDPELVDLLYAKAAANGLEENFLDSAATVHDDHVSFTQEGIPAVDLIDVGRGFPPYWHTTRDTMENLDAGMMGRIGALVLDVMQDARFTASWPGPC